MPSRERKTSRRAPTKPLPEQEWRGNVLFDTLKRWFGGGKTAEEKAPANPAKKSAVPEHVATLKDLEGFVDYVVKALVDVPEEVNVTTEDGENDTRVIKIKCRKEDTGKIIGKKGKTIIALRSLVGGAAGRLQERVTVEVVD